MKVHLYLIEVQINTEMYFKRLYEFACVTKYLTKIIVILKYFEYFIDKYLYVRNRIKHFSVFLQFLYDKRVKYHLKCFCDLSAYGIIFTEMLI